MRKPGSPRPSAPEDVDSGAAGATGATGPASGRRARGPGRELARQRAGGGLEVFGRGTATQPGPARRDRVVSTGLTDRLAEQRQAARSLHARRLGAVLIVLGVVAALVWALAFSPLLALRMGEVTVTGSDGTVSTEQVREVLATHEGMALVRLDVSVLGDEVADSLVRVDSASVTRSWPHGLTVTLTMRVPVAVRQVEAGYEVLDGEAVVLETVEQPPAGLVTIVSEDQDPDAAQVSAVAQVVGSLDQATREQVVSGSASASGRVTLTLASGATVVWGDTSESALKARVLAQLMTRQASTYDVSSPRSPTTS
ncbi:MAG: FtsQ-type POTRA domain-containing protein [Actinomyces sp.]|uniref:cell division protein FtsQ/DivIB n=1 Tax=Actinomyces sp. TaxID=29317 RepID=UPI0026DD5758|nr:FtsQ-type POTRA domain-containing protein [Actinomyces sp.]MDO4243900.1 FtsQ-type POTRA domain-containing protein [Actinomyces sp.]